jgi:hypothetical protein
MSWIATPHRKRFFSRLGVALAFCQSLPSEAIWERQTEDADALTPQEVDPYFFRVGVTAISQTSDQTLRTLGGRRKLRCCAKKYERSR